MLKAYIAIVLGLILVGADGYFFVQEYLLHFNLSNSNAKNAGLLASIIILMISSATSVGGGIDLKWTLYAIAQGQLGTSSLLSLMHQAAKLSKCLTITLSLQVISAITVYVLYKGMQKETKEQSKKYQNHWDLNKLNSK